MYRCPRCHSSQAMFVQVTITADVGLNKDGTTDLLCCRPEYDGGAEAWCGACPYQGVVADFYVSESTVDRECMKMSNGEWEQFAKRMGIVRDEDTTNTKGGSAK